MAVEAAAVVAAVSRDNAAAGMTAQALSAAEFVPWALECPLAVAAADDDVDAAVMLSLATAGTSDVLPKVAESHPACTKTPHTHPFHTHTLSCNLCVAG